MAITLFSCLCLKDQQSLCSSNCHTHAVNGNCSASLRVLDNSLRVVSAMRGNLPSVRSYDFHIFFHFDYLLLLLAFRHCSPNALLLRSEDIYHIVVKIGFVKKFNRVFVMSSSEFCSVHFASFNATFY